jgi:hypothetical protein
MTTDTVRIDLESPFALAEDLSAPQLEAEGRVRYLVVTGKQDDGLWGPIGALWVSQDGRRGGFLVNQWALWEGSEIVRGYGSALERGRDAEEIYRYWGTEVWPGSYVVDEEREAQTLMLLHELVAVL